MHLSVWALKYCSLYKPLSKKCSSVNYNLVHNCMLHPEKFSQNIILKCFVWKLSGMYKKYSFALHGNWWLHCLKFSTSLHFKSGSYHSFKTTYKQTLKKEIQYRSEVSLPRRSCHEKSPNNTYSYTCLSWNLSHGCIRSHQNKLFLCDWLWFMNMIGF